MWVMDSIGGEGDNYQVEAMVIAMCRGRVQANHARIPY